MEFDPTVTVSVICSLVIAVIGWIINWNSTRKMNRQAIENARKAARERNRDLDNMREQINTLKAQARSLQAQVDLETKREEVPRWELSQVKGVIYSVSNLNSYDAKDVEVISTAQTHELGDISAGSKQTFDYFESGLSGDFYQVKIQWNDPEGETRTVSLSVPPKR